MAEVLTWVHPFLFMFDAIFVPAEIGCEVGLHEGERVAHLVSQHLGPNSWMWGGVRGWSTMVGVMRKEGMCDRWCPSSHCCHICYMYATCVKLQKVCRAFSILTQC